MVPNGYNQRPADNNLAQAARFKYSSLKYINKKLIFGAAGV
jgi:hypothetical protein